MVAGERVEGTTKGGRERVVSLDAGTVDVLRAHRRRQLADLSVAGASWVDTGHVFTTGLGLPVYPDAVSQLMAKVIKAYNEPEDTEAKPARPLPHARLHELRHVHATMLLLAGVPVHVMADRLGHADPSITLRVYAHVIRQHAAGIADVFAAAVDLVDEDQDDDGDGSALTPC
jgi:integrase